MVGADFLIDVDEQDDAAERATTTKTYQYPLNEDADRDLDVPLSMVRHDGNATSGTQGVAMSLRYYAKSY
jgi:hypothetical protein